MGTSEQLGIGSLDAKRDTTLHHGAKKDPVIILDSKWKTKAQVPAECCPAREQTTTQRIFVPASNVERKKEEGCMNKIKIERTAKLDLEDRRKKHYNIVTGAAVDPQVWVGSMGKQAEGFKLG